MAGGRSSAHRHRAPRERRQYTSVAAASLSSARPISPHARNAATDRRAEPERERKPAARPEEEVRSTKHNHRVGQ